MVRVNSHILCSHKGCQQLIPQEAALLPAQNPFFLALGPVLAPYTLWGKWREGTSSPHHPNFKSRAGHLQGGLSQAAPASDHHTPSGVLPLHQESACPSLTGPFSLNNLETWFRYLRNPCRFDSSLKDELINAINFKFSSKWGKMSHWRQLVG